MPNKLANPAKKSVSTKNSSQLGAIPKKGAQTKTGQAMTKAALTALVDQLQATLAQQEQQIAELKQLLRTEADEKGSALEEAQALTHLGSWQWDIATSTISWSDELYRIYGLQPQVREIGYEEVRHLR